MLSASDSNIENETTRSFEIRALMYIRGSEMALFNLEKAKKISRLFKKANIMTRSRWFDGLNFSNIYGNRRVVEIK